MKYIKSFKLFEGEEISEEDAIQVRLDAAKSRESREGRSREVISKEEEMPDRYNSTEDEKALETACEDEDIESVKSLLKDGVMVNVNAVENAIYSGNLDIAKLVLDNAEFDIFDLVYIANHTDLLKNNSIQMKKLLRNYKK